MPRRLWCGSRDGLADRCGIQARAACLRRSRTQKCLERASEIEPRASQAYALEILWRACFEHPGHANAVWHRILELCHPDRSSRAARLYLHVAEIQNGRNPGGAAEVIGAMPPGKARRWLERRFGLA